MTDSDVRRIDLMRQLSDVRKRLREFGIRDAADYAEVLVAEALGGQRIANAVNKGHDVVAAPYGRIEVKCRQLPADGRIEERVEVGNAKKDGFDYLAVVVLYPDCSVKGAVIVPYSSVWKHIESQAYNRISYSQACALDGAEDITPKLRKAATK